MVTIQEIDEQEAQLNKVEVEAVNISNQPLPQRRYGFRITKQIQRNAEARRNEARALLPQIAEQRGQLENQRKEILSQQAQEAAIQKQIDDYNYGRKLATSGKATFGKLSKAAREGYQNAKESLDAYEARKAQLKAFEDQGLKPIFDNGKLSGFEDSNAMQSIPLSSLPKYLEQNPSAVSRYQKAGVIEVSTSTQNIDYSQLMSKPPRYEPFFGKVEKIIKYPFEKLADFNRFTEQPFQKAGLTPGFGVLKPKYMSEANPKDSIGTKAFLFAGDIASFPVYGLKELETYTFDKQAREEFKRLGKGQKALEVTNIGLSLYALGSISSSVKNFFFKSVEIKEFKYPNKYIAETEIKNIKISDKTIDIANFKVTSLTPPRNAFELKRFQLLAKGIITENQASKLSELSLRQLRIKFPEGKLVEKSSLKITQSVTEPFIIKNGKITRAFSREGEPVVFTYRGSYNSINKRFRINTKKLSILSGETFEGKTIKTISPSRKELPANVRKALEEIEKVSSPKGINIKEVFDKELKLETGGVRLEDFFKITKKGGKVIPEGKRITRAEIAVIQKSLMTINTNKEFGLKEIEILGERIGAVDTTFPRFRYPKKAFRIEGKVKRFEYEYPSNEPLGLFEMQGGGKKSSDAFLKQLYEKELNQKTIQKAIGATAISQGKIPSRIKTPKVDNVLEPIQRSAPAYAGTGLYERSEGGQVPGLKDIQVSVPSYRIKSIERISSKSISKELTKGISKEVTKALTRSLPKLTIKEITKEATKQTTKLTTKLTLKSTLKNPPKTPKVPRVPKNPRTPKSPPLGGYALKGEKGLSDLALGYRPYVIKKGKRLFLDGVFPKNKALKVAEQEAERSLRATFGIKKTRIRTNEEDIKFNVSKKLFRGYRIKAGRRIPLRNEFIQKRGQRLVFPGEKQEIQLARIMKRSKI